MKELLKKSMVTFSALVAMLMPVAVPVTVAAQASSPDIDSGLCAGASLSVQDSQNCDPAASTAEAEDKVDSIITTVINIFSLVVGVVSVIMIIIGGLKYITSGGDSGNVSGAKNTILYAIIGLVIVALAQIIVKFVLGRVTSA
jgi:hypothetical protein